MIPVNAAMASPVTRYMMTIPPSAISSPSGEYLSEVLPFSMMSVFLVLVCRGIRIRTAALSSMLFMATSAFPRSAPPHLHAEGTCEKLTLTLKQYYENSYQT